MSKAVEVVPIPLNPIRGVGAILNRGYFERVGLF